VHIAKMSLHIKRWRGIRFIAVALPLAGLLFTATQVAGGASLSPPANPGAPTANAGGPYSGDEGAQITFSGDASDPEDSSSALTYQWDFEFDGSFAIAESGVNLTNPTHVYTQDGTYTVALRAKDTANELSNVSTAEVTVANVPPSASVSGPYAVNEGSPLSLLGSADDPGNDTLTFEWDYDYDGTTFTVDASGEDLSSPTNTYTNDGERTVALRVRDGDGGVSTTQTALVTVSNVQPVANAGTSYTEDEGSAFTFNGSAVDPGNDTLTYEWDFTYSGGVFNIDQAGDGLTAPQYTYANDGDFTVALRVLDDDTVSAVVTASVTVTNVLPTASAGGPYTGTQGTQLAFSGSATDPGSNDSLTYEWDFEYDGATFSTVGPTTASGLDLTSPPYTYSQSGTFTVALRVSDDDGTSSVATAQVTMAAQGGATPTPTVAPTSTPVPTSTSAPAPTSTSAPAPTSTSASVYNPAPTSTSAPTPTLTPTPTPLPSITPTSSATSIPEVTPAPSIIDPITQADVVIPVQMGITETGAIIETDEGSMSLVTAEQVVDIGGEVGEVSVSINVDLLHIPENASLEITITEEPTEDASASFALAATNSGTEIDDIAFTVNVQRVNLSNETDLGEARITMSVSETWVEAHGGAENVRIFRFSDDGSVESLETLIIGRDPSGDIVFQGISPNGFSVFALVALKAAPPIPVPAGAAIKAFAPGTATTLISPDGKVTVSIPAIAPMETAYIFYMPGDAPAAPPAGLAFGTSLFDLTVLDPDGVPDPAIRFSRPITISVKYTSDDIQVAEGNPSKLALQKYDPAFQSWISLTTTFDPVAKTVRAQVSRLGFFALMGPGQPLSPTPTPTTVPAAPTATLLPPTPGDLAPGSGLLIGLLVAAAILISAGGYYLRQSRAPLN